MQPGNATDPTHHAYLAALGIDAWLPRTQLPAAAPSNDGVFAFCYPPQAVTETAPAISPPSVSDLAKPKTPQAPLSTTLEALNDPAPKVAKEKKETQSPPEPNSSPIEQQPAATDSEPVRFKLAFLQQSGCLIIDTLPPDLQTGFTPLHQKLASAILVACGYQKKPADHLSLLPWPMLASKTLNQNKEQAKLALTEKAKQLYSDQLPEHILVMGETAAQLLLNNALSLDEMRGQTYTFKQDVPLTVTFSLTQAMQLPGIKAEIWQDLQPLRQAAAKSNHAIINHTTI